MEFTAIRVCGSGYRAAEILVDFTEKHTTRGAEAQRALLKGFITLRQNSGQKGPSQGITQHSDPHEQSPYAPKLEDSDAWDMAKHVHKLGER